MELAKEFLKAFGLEVTSKSNTEKCFFLVAAALQEELNEFYALSEEFKNRHHYGGGVHKVNYTLNSKKIGILTYTPNQMGMPFNAASLMKVVSIHQPVYTIFIGTCAGLKTENRKAGDVLVPFRIFSYESGKYKDGKFHPDFAVYQTGDQMRKEAEVLVGRIKAQLKFQVITDEDFASGSAVIDDANKREEAIKHSGRKVSGLDMEAYAVACINFVLRPSAEFLVIKGISDFAVDKTHSELTGDKELAKTNAAQFALKLISHLYEQANKHDGKILL